MGIVSDSICACLAPVKQRTFCGLCQKPLPFLSTIGGASAPDTSDTELAALRERVNELESKQAFWERQAEEYQAWIEELEGPTPHELLVKLAAVTALLDALVEVVRSVEWSGGSIADNGASGDAWLVPCCPRCLAMNGPTGDDCIAAEAVARAGGPGKHDGACDLAAALRAIAVWKASKEKQ